MRLPLAALVVALATGCMVRARPTNVAVEPTVPSAPTAASLPRRLHVVTFNVHRERADVVIRGITLDPALRGADLILLEEVHRVEPSSDPCSAACALAKSLGMHAAYAPGHVQGDGTDGVAILSKAPILSTEVIELPDIDVHINSGRRVALVATILVEGAPVTVYAVHLTNRLTVAERRTQMRPVLAHVALQTTPIIMAGDFNTSPFTWLAGVIPAPIGTQDDHLEALVRSYGLETPVAHSGPTSRFMAMKLDAIYTRGFATDAFATAHAGDVSDHLALWANLELRGQNSVAASHLSSLVATATVPE